MCQPCQLPFMNYLRVKKIPIRINPIKLTDIYFLWKYSHDLGPKDHFSKKKSKELTYPGAPCTRAMHDFPYPKPSETQRLRTTNPYSFISHTIFQQTFSLASQTLLDGPSLQRTTMATVLKSSYKNQYWFKVAYIYDLLCYFWKLMFVLVKMCKITCIYT